MSPEGPKDPFEKERERVGKGGALGTINKKIVRAQRQKDTNKQRIFLPLLIAYIQLRERKRERDGN